MPNHIHTIGYEGASVDDFVSTLVAAGISHVIDVREIAASRRKGFSKRALQAVLENNKIRYTHLRGLGDPKEGREAVRAGRIAEFKIIFHAHLSSDYAQGDLRVAIETARQEDICLLCYERDQNFCHRTIVANLIAEETGHSVRPLGVRNGIAQQKSNGGHS
jgi:uncharacterized protein (DUF488 family)